MNDAPNIARARGRLEILSIVVCLSLFIGGTAAADDRVHMGVATCATSQCHGSAVPRDGSNVLQNEYVTWTRDDPHSKAWEVLGNEQSRAIASRLGLGSAQKANICLDCHADNVAPDRRGERFQLSDGVGCESCHGGAGDWLSSHDNVPAVTHADNVAAGMYPADDADSRAELCLSCHLGTEDRFATHRIMAAGHPRLAFELDTFSELWRTAGRQPHYRVDEDYRERKRADSHTYTWAAGLFADGRRRLALIMESRFLDGVFPELGLYDCHACHRSMKTVQWRALPRHGGAGPGVPYLSDGSFVMILALTAAISPDDSDELESALSRLHAAADAGAVRRAAGQLDDLLERLRAGLTPETLRNRERRILEEVLRSGAEGNYLDYISAEQAFMAVQMLAIETGDARLEAELDRLAAALDDDERYRPAQFASLLRNLE